MITKFWHVGLTVKDLDEAIAQYEELGFKLVQKFKKSEPKALAAHLNHSSGSGIEIFQWFDKNHPQVEFIKSHLAFISDDIDEDITKLLDRGYTMVIPKSAGVTVSYFTFLKDPGGNYIELAELKGNT